MTLHALDDKLKYKQQHLQGITRIVSIPGSTSCKYFALSSSTKYFLAFKFGFTITVVSFKWIGGNTTMEC